jgi:predicted CopG family antitoxin
MHTINIRNIDDSIYEKIKHESKLKGLSVNKLLLQILDKFFRKKKETELHDLDDLFGTWTEEEYRLINEGSEQARKIDEEMWQ